MIAKLELTTAVRPKLGWGKVVAPTGYRSYQKTSRLANERTGFQSRDDATQFHNREKTNAHKYLHIHSYTIFTIDTITHARIYQAEFSPTSRLTYKIP